MEFEPMRDVFDAGGRGLQHHGLRRANERAVLTVIGFNPGVSNADIARLSGLAPQTVSAILADIEQAGLIERGPVLRGRRGQPATPISLRAEGAYSIGVEIGWRHVDVLLLDLLGRVLSTRRWFHDYPDARTIAGDIAARVAELIDTLPEPQRRLVRGIGVAMPTNIAGNVELLDIPRAQADLWAHFDLIADLGKLSGQAVSIFNDGNAACWAELIAFPRPRPGNFIYFLIARYVAAGIVGDGTLWEGPSGNSANLGLMLVADGDGKPAHAHAAASITTLEKRLSAAGFNVDMRDYTKWDWGGFGPVLDLWIEDSAVALAQVVYNTTMVIETGLVVLDSVLPEAITARLVQRLDAALHNLPLQVFVPPQVLPGHLGALAPAIGAAELTLYRKYFSRTLADLVG